MTEPLDSIERFETPEGIDLELRPAGPVVRILAWGMDLLIRLAVYMVLFMSLAALGRVGIGIWLLTSFLLEWFYPVYFEVRHRGATPGKRTVGLQVIHDDGTPVGLAASFIRNLVRFVD